jgi:RNA polymerase primary sigma factor
MTSAIGQYFTEVSNSELLTPEEEVELSKRIQQGDMEARNKLVRCNLRLVIANAKKYIGSSLGFTDLIQEGNVGLCKAADRFDWTRGVKFSTYAAFWIKAVIIRAIEEKSRVIRMPCHINGKMVRYRDAKEKLALKMGREPNKIEMAAFMGEPLKTIETLEGFLEGPMSLDQEFGDEETLKDYISFDDEVAINQIEAEEIKNAVQKLLSELDDRERLVLEMRYGLVDGDQHILAEVGELLNLTNERIRQIQRDAEIKLRPIAEAMGIGDLL